MLFNYFRYIFLGCLCLMLGCGGGGSTPSRISVTVTPANVQLQPGEGTTFTAMVAGTANRGVTWSIQEGGAGGNIHGTGEYFAPALAGTYHVVATSIADTSKNGQATVTVPLTMTINTTEATLTLRETKQFFVTVSGANNSMVNWNVQEGTSGGTVTPTGLYTAPDVPGTYHLIAVSQATPQQTATITITVVAGGAAGTIQ